MSGPAEIEKAMNYVWDTFNLSPTFFYIDSSFILKLPTPELRLYLKKAEGGLHRKILGVLRRRARAINRGGGV